MSTVEQENNTLLIRLLHVMKIRSCRSHRVYLIAFLEISNVFEDSLSEMSEISDGPSEAVFKIYPAASVKGKELLLDGIGHKYGVKAKYPYSVTWICTARRGKTSASDTVSCSATVRQKDGVFSFGKKQHSCAKDLHIETKIDIQMEI